MPWENQISRLFIRLLRSLRRLDKISIWEAGAAHAMIILFILDSAYGASHV